MLAGGVDIGILLVIAGSVIHAWRGGNLDRAALVMVVVGSVGCVLIGSLAGRSAAVWIYAVVLANFLLIGRKPALLVSSLAILVLVQSGIRKLDLMYRIGGEEFVLIMPGTNVLGLATICENLRARTEAGLSSQGQPITVSIGAAELKADEDGADWLVRADLALYRAKRGGRNRVDVDQGSEPIAAALPEDGEADDYAVLGGQCSSCVETTETGTEVVKRA